MSLAIQANPHHLRNPATHHHIHAKNLHHFSIDESDVSSQIKYFQRQKTHLQIQILQHEIGTREHRKADKGPKKKSRVWKFPISHWEQAGLKDSG